MSRAPVDQGAEPLSDAELNTLQGRLGPSADLEGATTVRDVSEATGLPEIDVVAHLRRIRAETAFSEPPVARPSALPWIAGATLVVGLGVTWWRLYPDGGGIGLRSTPAVTSTIVSTAVRSVPTTPLATYSDGRDGPQRPPSGFQVEAIGQRTDRMGMGNDMGDVRALPYETVRDGLATSAAAIIEELQTQDGDSPAPIGTHYRGMNGGTFSPRPGYVRLSISGWAGSEVGWIAVPLTPAGRSDLRAMAERMLKESKQIQDEALAPVGDPKAGLVTPPPAFGVRFAGRRLDVQRGPRVSFAPIPVPTIAARLKAAILNAAFRDRRPPVGPWTQDAAADARIPQPKTSRVEIMSPEGVIVGDLPTVPGEEAATAREAASLADRAAKGIEGVNRRALEKDRKPGF